jgi:hypothetical protein
MSAMSEEVTTHRYGAGRLSPSAQGQWSGSLAVDGLTISAECAPVGCHRRSGSAGMRTIFLRLHQR